MLSSQLEKRLTDIWKDAGDAAGQISVRIAAIYGKAVNTGNAQIERAAGKLTDEMDDAVDDLTSGRSTISGARPYDENDLWDELLDPIETFRLDRGDRRIVAGINGEMVRFHDLVTEMGHGDEIDW